MLKGIFMKILFLIKWVRQRFSSRYSSNFFVSIRCECENLFRVNWGKIFFQWYVPLFPQIRIKPMVFHRRSNKLIKILNMRFARKQIFNFASPCTDDKLRETRRSQNGSNGYNTKNNFISWKIFCFSMYSTSTNTQCPIKKSVVMGANVANVRENMQPIY